MIPLFTRVLTQSTIKIWDRYIEYELSPILVIRLENRVNPFFSRKTIPAISADAGNPQRINRV